MINANNFESKLLWQILACCAAQPNNGTGRKERRNVRKKNWNEIVRGWRMSASWPLFAPTQLWYGQIGNLINSCGRMVDVRRRMLDNGHFTCTHIIHSVVICFRVTFWLLDAFHSVAGESVKLCGVNYLQFVSFPTMLWIKIFWAAQRGTILRRGHEPGIATRQLQGHLPFYQMLFISFAPLLASPAISLFFARCATSTRYITVDSSNKIHFYVIYPSGNFHF